MRVRPVALGACVASALSVLMAPTTSAAPSAQSPGDVLDSQEQRFLPNPVLPSKSKSWKIHYRSTDARGAGNTVSGTVIVPDDGKTGTRPLVTYAVGTVGLADKCAPSATFPYGLTKEGTLIQQAIARGWAVAVTDYEGIGTPGTHTYTVGRAEGTAVLDAARAAQRLPQARERGVNAKSPVGIMGYSQGGQASSWAAELHGSYAPELDVKGTATGGVPADLNKVADFNDGNIGSGLIAMAAVGQDAAFPELRLDTYLNARGKLQKKIAENSCVEIGAASWPLGRIEDITVKNPLDEPDWQRRLAESRLGGTAPDAPVFLYHGAVDELIPYGVGTALRDEWRGKGASVTWKSLPLGHVTGAVAGSPLAMKWLAARFTD
ncbi:lipase family protein [Streptomyces iconiensis]|uniref:Lipase family protein n=1 Tax=Streptomyces iconiensis TaxID=1384038 RepID=A0ABT7A391_9ACTN|nr:lipase family protein [Streptomyces iconiensis]MDJ1135787.1 lipase family protein [Streptomyces iconiensis]